MKTIHSVVSRNSYRIPPRLKLVATRLGSLLLLFQRMPVVQFLFPQANLIGGASVANTISLAVTTVVGLGAFDSVAGQTTIDEVTPIAKAGPDPASTATTKAINVPATVSAPLDFEFECYNAPSDPESWQIVTSAGAATTLPAGLTMTYTNTTPVVGRGFAVNNFITGTPTLAGIHPVYIRVWRGPNYTSSKVTQLFNICVLGFTTQPAASTTINSGETTTLTCTVTGNPAATSWHNVGGTLTYQWYEGLSGDTSTPVGTTNSSPPGFNTPNLTSSTNYWVRIKSVLGTSTVYANSNTAAVTVNAASSPFESWASGLSEGQNGPTQTPQGDGVTNLEKFAFNLLPGEPDVRRLTVGGSESAGLPAGAKVGGVLRMEFLRRKASTNPGITYTPQFSSSLGGWEPFSGTESISAAANPDWERVRVDDPVGGTQRFGRVKVEQTP